MATEPTDCPSGIKKWTDFPQGGIKGKKKKKGEKIFLLLTGVVNQNASILASPDLVPPDFRIAASPVKKK